MITLSTWLCGACAAALLTAALSSAANSAAAAAVRASACAARSCATLHKFDETVPFEEGRGVGRPRALHLEPYHGVCCGGR
jgi:hypothetical protein